MLIIRARIVVLKKNDTSECTSETLRMGGEQISMSAVCEATPMMNEK